MASFLPNDSLLKVASILIVDDEEKNRKLLRHILERVGYRVFEAIDGDDALKKIDEISFDLILLDIVMPKISGFEVCQKLKEDPQRAHIPIIIVTMLSEREDRLTAIDAGADDFLTKPIDVHEVILRVRNAVHRKQLFDEVLAFRTKLEQKVAEQTKEIYKNNVRLKQYVKELEARDRLVRFQMKGPTLEEAYTEIVQVMVDVLQVEELILYGISADHAQLVAVQSYGVLEAERFGDKSQSVKLPGAMLEDTTSLPVDAYQQQKLLCDQDKGVAAPVIYRDKVVGVVWVNKLTDDRVCREAEMEVFWRLVMDAALVVHSARLTDDLCSGRLNVGELLKLQV